MKNYLVKVTAKTESNEYVVSLCVEAEAPGVAIMHAITRCDTNVKTWDSVRIAHADLFKIEYNAKFIKEVTADFAIIFNDYHA